jgi:hypothetical protein
MTRKVRGDGLSIEAALAGTPQARLVWGKTKMTKNAIARNKIKNTGLPLPLEFAAALPF